MPSEVISLDRRVKIDATPSLEPDLNAGPSKSDWLKRLILELEAPISNPVDAHRFRTTIAERAFSRGTMDGVEHRYVLRRINSERHGLHQALTRALGEKDDYVLAFQQLSYALSVALRGAEDGARQIASARANLMRAAPSFDRSLLATDAPLSFVVTCMAGWWLSGERSGMASTSGDDWSDAHAAARADLIAVLDGA